MNYKLLSQNQAENVRSKFEQAFIMTPPEYETHYKKWEAEVGKDLPRPVYTNVIYWSKTLVECQIDFKEAIAYNCDDFQNNDTKTVKEELPNRLCFLVKSRNMI